MAEENARGRVTSEEEPITRRAARMIVAEGYALADLGGFRVKGISSINSGGIGILTQRPEPEPVGCLGLLGELACLTFGLITCQEGDEALEERARFVGALYTDPSEWKLRVVGRDNILPLKGLMEKIAKENMSIPPVTISLAREEPLYERYVSDGEIIDDGEGDICDEEIAKNTRGLSALS